MLKERKYLGLHTKDVVRKRIDRGCSLRAQRLHMFIFLSTSLFVTIWHLCIWKTSALSDRCGGTSRSYLFLALTYLSEWIWIWWWNWHVTWTLPSMGAASPYYIILCCPAAFLLQQLQSTCRRPPLPACQLLSYIANRSGDNNMAPPGPPPYTHEQITAMTSQEERIRAYAELKSMWERRTNKRGISRP